MPYAHLIHQYGYAALLLGTFLEGDTVLLLGAAAAQLGLLALPWVLAAGLAGNLLADQAWFLAGRRGGPPVLALLPRVRARTGRVLGLVERRPDLLILGYRALYGLRIATLVLLGMSRVPTGRFTVLNAVSGLLWAGVLGAAGYLAAGAAMPSLGNRGPALLAAAFALTLVVAAARLLRRPV